MNVYPTDRGIVINPETQFEEVWLKDTFMSAKREVILKSGLSLGDIVGLEITAKKEEKVDG